MRRAFTLIELLAVVAVIAVMTTVGLVSLSSGQGAVRVKGAARDIFAVIRHARSVALVSQQPSTVTYATETIDGEVCAKIDVRTAKLMQDDGPTRAKTLQGEDVIVGGDESDFVEKDSRRKGTPGFLVDGKDPTAKDGATAATGEDAGGQSVEDILFAPVSSDVMRGIRLKVVKAGETLERSEADTRREKPKVSVFSNIDYILGRLSDKLEKEKAEQAQQGEASSASAKGAAPGAEDQAPVSILWEANGRVEPHRVYVYRDGTEPEKGLCIKVDRFGAAKVLGAGEDDDD